MQKHLEKLKPLYKYFVAGILIAVPLFPKFPFINIPGTFVAIRLEDFLILITFILWFLLSLNSIKSYLRSDITRSILIFIAVGLTATLFGALVLNTVVLHIGILHWIRRIEYFTAFFIGYLAIKNNPKDIAFYFKLILIVVGLVFLYGYGQKNWNWPIIITQNLEYSKGVALRWIPGSHINSTFAGHYDLATFLVLILPIIVSSFFLIKGWVSKIIIGSSFFFSLWLMVNAASRISLVSYLVSTVIALIIIKKYKAIILVSLISLVFVSMSSNLTSRYLRFFEVAKERYFNFEKSSINLTTSVFASEDLTVQRKDNPAPTPTPAPVFEDRSTSIRLNVEWPRAIRAFTKNPLLGTGYSSITLATDNDYLRLLGELGILGFFSFILIFLRIVLRFLKQFPLDKKYQNIELAFVAGVFSSIAGIILNGFFIDVAEASKFAIIYWLMMGMAISLIKRGSYEE